MSTRQSSAGRTPPPTHRRDHVIRVGTNHVITAGEAAAGAGTVYFVVPGDVDDPAVPSGGNVYDLRVCEGLAATGRTVHRIAVPGAWPRPAGSDNGSGGGSGGGGRGGGAEELARVLAALPDGATVLMDGLVACGVPEIVVPETERLRIVVLVHLPLAAETGLAPELAEDLEVREGWTLWAAHAVVATSGWAARRLIDDHGLPVGKVHVAEPGTDRAPLAAGSATGGAAPYDAASGAARLLCVASVTPRKGHDLLIEALAAVADLPWTCECAGPLGRDPGHAGHIRRLIAGRELGDRVLLTGPRSRAALERAYDAADLVLLPSRAETYGMVVTEALARGIPVIGAAVGGVPDALGRAPDGELPGLLVPPEDPAALATELRRWFSDPALRRRLRESARQRRRGLRTWERTARDLARVLDPGPAPGPEADARPTETAVRPAEAVRPEPAGLPGAERFRPDWLALREPADAAARCVDLLAPLSAHLARTTGRAPDHYGRLVIRDLGCGTGSQGRWLAGRLAAELEGRVTGPQHWILHDRDPGLLARAVAQGLGTAGSESAGPLTVETREGDLTGLRAADLAGTSLVTASALLDLLTVDEVERLAAACAQAGCPALFTLSVAGKVELTPAGPLDAEITEAFNAHQRRTAPDGRLLLGPDAVDAAVEAFERYGMTVLTRPSPWRLGAEQQELAAEWFLGWVAAAVEQRPELELRAAGYVRDRLEDCAAGRLGVVVHHRDLLALPGALGGLDGGWS